MKKTCKRCGDEREITEFGKAKGCKDGVRPVCKVCIYKQTKAFKESNPEHFAKVRRKASLKHLYGITEDQYNEMFYDQKGKCDICLVHQDKLPKRLCVDHNHDTGAVRGLLCDSCNRGLGYFKDKITIVDFATDYLFKHHKE